MIRIIRRNTFETNSSSTHSLTMCMKSEYDEWVRGNLLLTEDMWGDFNVDIPQFVTHEKAVELLKNNYNTKYIPNDMDWNNAEQVNALIREAGFKTCDDAENEECDLESFLYTFTTPSGDTIVSFGAYGYDS